MTETTIPAVNVALGEILKKLSVDKNGQLPSNMGGKPYITAADINMEVKRLFVEYNLQHFPTERMLSFENMVMADRAVKTSIVIEGTYTITSLEDGSSVAVTGIGDGLASGSAVASNIASTNALKNALLRLFLITEQSVEDAGKSGPAESQQPAPPKQSGPSVPALKGEIATLLGTKDAKVIMEKGNEFFKGREGWDKSAEALTKWRDELKG